MKDKNKYFNLFWCLPTAISYYITISIVINWYTAAFLAVIHYTIEVRLEDLKDKNAELQNTVNELLEWKNNSA